MIASGSVSDGRLAALRKDCFFTAAPRRKEPELCFEQKPRRAENACVMCTEDVAPHETVKLTLSGHIGHGSAATTVNKLENKMALPYDAGCAFARALIAKNASALADLNNAMIHETKRQLKEQIQKQFKGRGVPNTRSCPSVCLQGIHHAISSWRVHLHN